MTTMLGKRAPNAGLTWSSSVFIVSNKQRIKFIQTSILKHRLQINTKPRQLALACFTTLAWCLACCPPGPTGRVGLGRSKLSSSNNSMLSSGPWLLASSAWSPGCS